MERYNCKLDNVGIMSYVNVTLEKMNDTALEDRKHASIVQGRLYSFLYFDKSNNLGGGERIVRGRVTNIIVTSLRSTQPSLTSLRSTQTRFCNDYMDQDLSNRSSLLSESYKIECEPSHITIVVDASIPGFSKIEKLNLANILDIRDICYNWNTEENPKLIPNDPDFPVWEKGFTPGDDEYITSVTTKNLHTSRHIDK